MDGSKFNQSAHLIIKICLIGEDTDDIIDKNQIGEIYSSIVDLNNAVHQTETYQTNYRSKYKEFQGKTGEEYHATV